MNKPEKLFDAVVAGHVCLDIIPRFQNTAADALGTLLTPGRLVNVGQAALSTGGAVSNTGLALLKLGIKTLLMGKVGDDFFAAGIRALFRAQGPDADAGLTVVPGEGTSYSIVLAPPGIDRVFLHHPGANDTFCADDVNYALVSQARLFHLGYPPLMRGLYAHGARELVEIFRRVKNAGVTTSIDMSLPDPNSESGRVPWRQVLERLLPLVDLAPLSAEEAMFMLDRERFDRLKRAAGQRDPLDAYTADDFEWIGRELLRLGAGIAAVKCGHHGLLLFTGSAARIAAMGAAAPSRPNTWADRALWEEPFAVEKVASATGAGDSCVAGFLAALLRGCSPEQALKTACCVGAQNVKVLDAVSGIHTWEQTQAMIPGWSKARRQPGGAWSYCESKRVWRRPCDTVAHSTAEAVEHAA
jgi:sugar/nucleoside kinase (ribokinase family)